MTRSLIKLSLVSLLLVAPANAKAHEGWGIVRDAHGRLYVADIPANTIWRIDGDGRLEAVLRDVHSHNLAIGADGGVYGTDVHLTQPIRGLWRLDMSGQLTHLIPPTRGFALDLQPFLMSANGSVYSVSLYQAALPPEQRQLFLLRHSSSGAIDTIAGGLKGDTDGMGSAARFSAIDGMAWLPDSSLLLVDGARLRRVMPSGRVETLAGPLTQPRWGQDMMGASVGPGGEVYVADFAGRRIIRVAGKKVRTVATTGWFWAPTGVVVAPDGLYTMEHPRAPLGILGDLGIGAYLRIRHIRPDGTVTVLAKGWGRHTKPLAGFAGGFAALMLGALLWRWN